VQLRIIKPRALSVTKRTPLVVFNSTIGTGQFVPFSTTSMRQGCTGAPKAQAHSAARARVVAAAGFMRLYRPESA